MIDAALYDYLRLMHGRTRQLEHRVHSRQSDLILMFAKWNQELEARCHREADEKSQSSRGSSSRGGAGAADPLA